MTDPNDPTARAAVTKRAADAGAAVAQDSFRQALQIEYKDGKTDAVTQTDRAAQEAVIDAIRETYPDEPIIGEEEGALKRVPEDGPAWIVDPIDGTNNYIRGNPLFATAVAAVIDGEPVGAAIVMPALEDTYHAGPFGVTRNGDSLSVSDRSDPETATVCPTLWWDLDSRDQYTTATREIVTRFGDLRRIGSAQTELAMVASGALEGTFSNLEAYPWDTVAGVYMVRAAGGTVTDLEGTRWRHDSRGLVASNGQLHQAILEAAQAI